MRLNDLIKNKAATGIYRLAVGESMEAIQSAVEVSDYHFWHIDGQHITDKESLIVTIRDTLELSETLGTNWDAFYDMLTGFAWIESAGYVMLYSQPEIFAQAYPDDFQKMVAIVQQAAVDTDPNRKFYMLIQSDDVKLDDKTVTVIEA